MVWVFSGDHDMCVPYTGEHPLSHPPDHPLHTTLFLLCTDIIEPNVEGKCVNGHFECLKPRVERLKKTRIEVLVEVGYNVFTLPPPFLSKNFHPIAVRPLELIREASYHTTTSPP